MTIVTTNRGLYPSFSSLIDDFFNVEMGDWKRNNYSSSNTTLPKVNVLENTNGFLVEMAAPGMTKSDFIIELDNGVLTIRSNKDENSSEQEMNYVKREFAYQSFSRSFTLPETANFEKIRAAYENGILRLSIPKREEAKPKPARTIRIS